MRTRSWLLVATCAVVGVVAGVGTGLALTRTHHADPLGLGFPQVNLGCDGQVILAVGFGDSAPVLSAAAQEEQGKVRYLDTRRSCRTAWSDNGTTPTYVVYRTYPTRQAACDTRMSPEHRGDRVLRMDDQNTQPVMCLCYVMTKSLPTLGPTPHPPDVLHGIYISALQNLLVALNLRADPKTSGVFDPQTVAAIKSFQVSQRLAPTGVVGPDTWHSLLHRGCPKFTS